MSDIQVFIASDIPAVAAPTAGASVSAHRGVQGVSVEVASVARLAELRSCWTDLLARADVPNVLMDPAMVQAAAEVFPEAQSQALLAWKSQADGKRRLSGIWAFSIGRP